MTAASDPFAQLRRSIAGHKLNKGFTEKGYGPLFAASAASKIVIIGQAPGIKAQASGKPWDDASGRRLIQWLGVNETQFYNEQLFAHMPMDFYYPGKGPSGDLPPRKVFAALWHPQLLELMPKVQLTIVIGRYAQKHYLPHNTHPTLTETVLHYQDFLPDYFPLVHPSPLNFRWFKRNPWFETANIPELQNLILRIMSTE